MRQAWCRATQLNDAILQRIVMPGVCQCFPLNCAGQEIKSGAQLTHESRQNLLQKRQQLTMLLSMASDKLSANDHSTSMNLVDDALECFQDANSLFLRYNSNRLGD